MILLLVIIFAISFNSNCNLSQHASITKKNILNINAIQLYILHINVNVIQVNVLLNLK